MVQFAAPYCNVSPAFEGLLRALTRGRVWRAQRQKAFISHAVVALGRHTHRRQIAARLTPSTLCPANLASFDRQTCAEPDPPNSIDGDSLAGTYRGDNLQRAHSRCHHSRWHEYEALEQGVPPDAPNSIGSLRNSDQFVGRAELTIAIDILKNNPPRFPFSVGARRAAKAIDAAAHHHALGPADGF